MFKQFRKYFNLIKSLTISFLRPKVIFPFVVSRLPVFLLLFLELKHFEFEVKYVHKEYLVSILVLLLSVFADGFTFEIFIVHISRLRYIHA